MKLTTYAARLAGKGTLSKEDVVTLAKAAAKDGVIKESELTQLKSIRENMADKMDRGAKAALTRLINNIPDNDAVLRRVDPEKVKNLIDGDPRLAWRSGGRTTTTSSGGSESGGSVSSGGGYVSSGGGESGGSVRYTPTPSYTSSGGGE